MQPPDSPALRQAVLAVSVLDDMDLTPADDGVLLDGPPRVHVSWRELHLALGGINAGSDLARLRLASWLRARVVAQRCTSDELRAAARPVGLPVGHVLHPGETWVRRRVSGGALELGFGFAGVGGNTDEVMVIPPEALAAARHDPLPWWPVAVAYLEKMGALAALRLRRTPMLRPVGDCDVVTLLGARSLREALCAGDPTGMRAASVPSRDRGWLDPSRIDPAFTAAAAAATDAGNRGFPRPVLVTVDEVALARAGGRPAEIVLRDPAVQTRR